MNYNPQMARLPDPIRVTPSLRIPAAEVRLAYARSGGPGGQHVNKTASKVQLFWSLRDSAVVNDADRAWLEERLASKLTGDGEIVVAAETSRSQSRNVDFAVEKLVALLREALKRPKRRRKTKPTRASRQRRIDEKKRRAETKRMRKKPEP